MKKAITMRMSRRQVMRGLGGGMIAGASGGLKQSAEAARVAVTGLESVRSDHMFPGSASGESPQYRVLKSLGYLPEFKKGEFRNRARRVRALDPDLAAVRSMSLVARVQIQRRRNYDRYIRDYYEEFETDIARTAFCKKFGIDWL